MKKFKKITIFISLSLLIFIILQLLGILTSLFNYYIYLNKYGIILSDYFKQVVPSYRLFWIAHNLIMRYILLYIIFCWAILKKYKENNRYLFIFVLFSVFQLYFFTYELFIIWEFIFFAIILYFLPYNIFFSIVILYRVYFLYEANLKYMAGSYIKYYNAMPYSIDNLTEDVRYFLKERKFNRLYVTDVPFEVANAYTVYDSKGDIMIIAREYLSNPIHHYILIHEYGHIINHHGYISHYYKFLKGLISYVVIFILPIYLSNQYILGDIEKKLQFLLFSYMFRSLLLITYLNLFNNSFTIYKEWQADNFVIKSGFGIQLAKHLILRIVDFPNTNYDHFCISSLLNIMNFTHPISFKRILNILNHG